MKKLDAALFDVDGTLLNTDQFILQAFKHTLKEAHGREIDWQDLVSVIGKPLAECYDILQPGSDSSELAQVHMKFQQQNLHLSTPYPGCVETLKTLYDSGLKIAAVTSRHNDSLEETLRLAGILGFFDVLVSADDVVHHKPHPEPVLKALEQLNISADRAVMTGDTGFDIEAGKSAGTKTVGVTFGFIGDKIKESDADFFVDSLEEIIPILIDEN